MIQYHPNNIIFRIASSDAISKFKALQADSFIQIARRELQFESSSREVLLLEYDRLSKVIFSTENICTYVTDRFIPKSALEAVKQACKIELKNAEKIFCEYSDIFHANIINFIKVVHGYSLPIINDKIDLVNGNQLDRGFGQIVSVISDYLQHVLLCLHEINSALVMKREPFLTISNFDVIDRCDDSRFIPLLSRAEALQALNCGNRFVLKNYMLHNECENIDEEDIFDKANDMLSRKGFSLIKETLESESDNALVAYG